jgi:hypothetical protein
MFNSEFKVNPPVNNVQDFDIIVEGGPIWSSKVDETWKVSPIQMEYFKTTKFNLEKSTIGIFLSG